MKKVSRLWNWLKDLSGLTELVYSLFAIVFALIIGAILIYLSGHDALEAYYYLFFGAFGNIYNLAQTLLKSIPLIFTGLAVAIGFQSGLFNIGIEGQLYWGAFTTAVVVVSLPGLSGYLLIPIALFAGALAGGIWGAFPGYLKAKTGAHEVITTIMLNYVGILATTFLLKNFFKAPGPVDQTKGIPMQARIPELFPNTRLTWSLFIGIAVIILVKYLFSNTSLGYDLQAVGANTSAAEYGGISVSRVTVLTMTISGAVAALAGSTIVLGVLHRFITNFSPGYGFTGIAVAVLGRNKPEGVLAAALLFGALDAGKVSMQLFTNIPGDLITVVQGLVILLVAAPSLIRLFSSTFGRGRELIASE
ncbi:ABC transporter permease [Candidatus Bipolaricaulota bacterium]|nr:ABC transporter permease [Candidatus Bipolaricaulota bacterium]